MLLLGRVTLLILYVKLSRRKFTDGSSSGSVIIRMTHVNLHASELLISDEKGIFGISKFVNYLENKLSFNESFLKNPFFISFPEHRDEVAWQEDIQEEKAVGKTCKDVQILEEAVNDVVPLDGEILEACMALEVADGMEYVDPYSRCVQV